MMDFIQSFIEALESILSNKLRSGLTMLGVIIGVAAVIAMLAIGNGAQQSIIGEIEGIGTNLLFIRSGGDAQVTAPLTIGDMEAVGDPLQAPSVALVAASVSGQAEVTFAGESTYTSVVGVTPDYVAGQNLCLTEGEGITEQDMDGLSSVAILGTEVAEELFGRAEGLVGETLRIAGQPFRVIGVIEEQGGTAFGSADDQVLVPVSTAQVRIHSRPNRDQVDMIYVSASSAESVPQAIEEVNHILQERHRTAIGEDDFTITSQQAFIDTASTVTGVLTIFLGGIAGISLLVGGIGIMNIMLVSVMERTKEIGLRKALGARKKDIQTQFLVESLVVSLIGGILGILGGWGISALVGALASSSSVALNPVMGVDSVLLATLFSVAVGIFFGLYPANRAATLEPVEALRSE
jgi:putative ABC transport system permease protein